MVTKIIYNKTSKKSQTQLRLILFGRKEKRLK